MNILVVGGGGREHALVWKLSQSPLAQKIYVAPGNPGMEGAAELVDIKAGDLAGLVAFAKAKAIDLAVVGPEDPLCAGLADQLCAAGIKVAGPPAAAARLEGSKLFAKQVMQRNQVPTAAFEAFTDPSAARDYIKEANRPLVLKADGLAAGKGVLLCKTVDEALAGVETIMVQKAFGSAGDILLVEEWLVGEEASFLVFSDGKTIVPMPTSQDHKAVGEGDTGLNTGGMGAYSPAPVVTAEVAARAMNEVIKPMISGMAAMGAPYKGILYAGLMVAEDGTPNVLEFNVRFGDPECQPLLMRLDSDLAEILLAMAEERLGEVEVAWTGDPTVCVVLASGGYPESYQKGHPISGLAQAAKVKDVVVFHAGTARGEGGRIVNSGGRVLGVTARGKTIRQAIDKAYQVCDMISWRDMYLRRDIGHRALAREGE